MNRVIRKSKSQSSREAANLLGAIFTAELTKPSSCLWLVSPWISDIPILDNSTFSFEGVRAWGPRAIRLSEMLMTLADRGSTVVIGTTSDATNNAFRQRAHRLFEDRGLESRLLIDVDASGELHEKAITGDDFVVVGSMNITNNGVFVREEFIEFRLDEEFVARSRMDAYERFGGVL
jgi:hypothetical protein